MTRTEELLDAIRAYGDARGDVAYGRATRKAIDIAWAKVLIAADIPPMTDRASAEGPTAADRLGVGLLARIRIDGRPLTTVEYGRLVDECAALHSESDSGLDMERLARAVVEPYESDPTMGRCRVCGDDGVAVGYIEEPDDIAKEY